MRNYELASRFNSPRYPSLPRPVHISLLPILGFSAYKMLIALILSLFALSVLARDVVFPPLAAVHTSQQYLSPFKDDPAVLLAGADFHGLSTYANLPYVKCMSAEEEVEKYDIAILGAPFDTVSTCSSIIIHITGKRTRWSYSSQWASKLLQKGFRRDCQI